MPTSKSLQRKLVQNGQDASAFSKLTYLLQLVTAINSNDNFRSGFKYQEKARNEASESSHLLLGATLLDSIVAILVQRYEVVAACHTSDKVSVVVAETDPNPSTDLDSDESPAPGSHTYYPLRLAAVSNPDFNSSYSKSKPKLNANLHNLQTQPIGDNLWTKVRDSCRWRYVFM